jgi:hypothetical protein
MMRFLILVTSLFLGVAFPLSSMGQIVYVRSAGEDSIAELSFELASRFYGVHMEAFTLQPGTNGASLLARLSNRDTMGVVITMAALPNLQRNRVLPALRRLGKQRIPLLIVGATAQKDSGLLAEWSNGTLSGCQPLSSVTAELTYVFGATNDVTAQLAGEHIPAASVAACSFVVSAHHSVEPLLSALQDERPAPVFVRISAEHTFYLAAMGPLDHQQSADLRLGRIFAEMAPMLMFVRDAAGERAWHSVGHYANLSIDDAWLVEPYGHLNYKALLSEMECHNFHTTVSFIPWNFDRSSPEVVSLFQGHQDKLSVSVHGNNHDHREFADLETVPLKKQVANIQQAIARMRRFTALTGVSYDPIMIFPHDTGPVATLAELKRYGFLATAYSLDLPLGAARPRDPLFYLRTFNLNFANFPALNRYFAEKPTARLELAMNAFLDNPILFYGHQKLFDGGIQAFNRTADAVNGVQPDTRWCSLGCVTRHLYLVKLREDGNFDTEIFSSDVSLENLGRLGKFFMVKKAENFTPEIQSVTVDGEPQSFVKEDGFITLKVFVPAGQSRDLRIEYANDWNVGSTDVSKSGLRIALLREISDFRDLTLSRHSWGRALTAFYYDGGLDSIELKIEKAIPALLALMFLIAITLAARLARRKMDRARINGSVRHPIIKVTVSSK